MGGKHWNEVEEEVFWTSVVPLSTRRAVRDPNVSTKNWDSLVPVMEREMAARNIPPRRSYTGLSLCMFGNTSVSPYHHALLADNHCHSRALLPQH